MRSITLMHTNMYIDVDVDIDRHRHIHMRVCKDAQRAAWMRSVLAPLYPHTDLARAAVGWGAKPVSASIPDPQECEPDVARAPEGDHDQAAHAPAKSRRAGEAPGFSASPAPTKAGASGLPVCPSFGTCRGGCRQAGRFFFRPGRQAAGLPRARAQRESGSRERADTKRRDLRHVPLGLGGGGRVRGPCLCAKALSLRQRLGDFV